METGRQAGHGSRPETVFRRFHPCQRRRNNSGYFMIYIQAEMHRKCQQVCSFQRYVNTFSQPWCNRDVRRISHRKRRAYKKACASKTYYGWQRYKKLQKESQTACRNTHSNYIRDMISEPGSKYKKLCSYVRGME